KNVNGRDGNLAHTGYYLFSDDTAVFYRRITGGCETMTLKLGISKVDITPIIPIGLAGFAHRKEKTKEVYNKLYVKTSVFLNNGQYMMLIVADLIWWDNVIVEKL